MAVAKPENVPSVTVWGVENPGGRRQGDEEMRRRRGGL